MNAAATSLAIMAVLALIACRHEADTYGIDRELLERARSAEASVWYANDDALLERSSGSGHLEALLRTRFNAKAARVLDDDGRVVEDTVFPTGSLIVKELWSNTTTLGTYAVMLKRPGDPAADPDGWIWGYLRETGEVRVSALDRGASCRSCHSQSGNIDRTLMNAYFP